jgi:hypothetical protein
VPRGTGIRRRLAPVSELNCRRASALLLRARSALTRAGFDRVILISMTRFPLAPSTRTDARARKAVAGALSGVRVSPAVVVVVVAGVDGVPELVLVGSVGSGTVGSGIVGVVTVTQPTTGRQSCGAAGTALEKTPEARRPPPKTAPATRTRPTSRRRGNREEETSISAVL